MAAKKKVYKKKKTKKKKLSKEEILTRRIAISALLIAIVGISSFLLYRHFSNSEPQKFESVKYFVKGIDVSHHQPILNWQMVSEQGISFAYLKATEGNSHLDRNYADNYLQAHETSIIVGSYHFYTFGISGKEQAQHFIRTAKCQSGDLIPAVDVEHSKINIYSRDQAYIALVKHELHELLQTLYNHFGLHPIIYTNKECYRLYIEDEFPDNPLWICNLTEEPSDKYKNWKIWQFSHSGKLPGIQENVDLNYYRYSFSDFKELLVP